MKKILLIMLVLGSYINVLATGKDFNKCLCLPGDNLCDTSCKAADLFTICVNRLDCTTITTETIYNNQKYGNFEIKDREIYLNDSNILSLKFDNAWTSLNYKIHITGSNIIRQLTSINAGKYSKGAEEYPQIYTSDFIPFTVVGDGTLEIEQAKNVLKVDTDGNVYYNHWYYNPPYEVSDEYRDISKSNLLANRFCNYTLWDNGATYGASCSPVDYIPLAKKDIVTAFINRSDNPRFIDDTYSTEMQATSYPKTLQNVKDLLDLNNYLIQITKCHSVGCVREQVINHILDQNIIVGTFPEYENGQISREWGEDNIQTDLTRSYNDNGHYVIGAHTEELETVTTTQTGNIIFESTESFDSNYHLNVEDITENITETDARKIEAKTNKTLIKLYGINMLDKGNKVVDMPNGTYTIKVALSDLLKKYSDYQVVYINESEVELIPVKVEDGYIVFNTTYLSKYGIVGLEKTTKKDIITGENITNPKTADSIVTYGLLLFSLIISTALVVLRIRKLKEN